MQLEKLLPTLVTAALAIAIPTLKYLYTLTFCIDPDLKKKAKDTFFIPTYTDITKVVFKKITEENKYKIRKHIEHMHSILNSNNTRYYVPEVLAFQLDKLQSLFYSSNNIDELNTVFQKFCDIYFVQFNIFKDSAFILKYSIVPNQEKRVRKLQWQRTIIFIIISSLSVIMVTLILFSILFVLILLVQRIELLLFFKK